jgi:hypothetical protein
MWAFFQGAFPTGSWRFRMLEIYGRPWNVFGSNSPKPVKQAMDDYMALFLAHEVE